jgi:dATP pyrophosphohydrolase
VLVFPFRRAGAVIEYAIFQRSDDGSWQGVAGGGEDSETPAEAASREAAEEGAIPDTAPIYRLQATSTVPVVCISANARTHWPSDLYVIPNYAFAIDCTALELRLSAEHRDFTWARYDQACALLRWDNNKVALWELNERLERRQLPPSTGHEA